MKKVLLIILILGLTITFGCSVSSNSQKNDANVSGASIPVNAEESNQASNADSTELNPFFFQSGTTQLKYEENIIFEDAAEKDVLLHINEIDNLKNGRLYELKLDSDDRVPEDRLLLGFFYVQKNKIYKIVPTEANLKKLRAQGEIPSDSIIVCQDNEIKDSLNTDDKGLHQYIKADGNTREYHSYNNQTETGYYESFTWERNKGLVNYSSGFGAERDSIELHLK